MRDIADLTREFHIQEPVTPDRCPVDLKGKKRIHIIALGDVGTTMLIGLRLLGGDVTGSIGICDIRQENCARLEMEINQIGYPDEGEILPPVDVVTEDRLFDCDVLIFCASRGVPSEQERLEGERDVRMAQLSANREIIRHYAGLAKAAAYQGLVCIVSDPVDPLAAAFLDASGLHPAQIQGYGLGVMHRRALYFARRIAQGGADETLFLTREEERHAAAIALYEQEGRAYGPHGEDLVIANSLTHYDEAASRVLTRLTVEANLRVRELGYKPYIAPALSSAAISILLTLSGQWHYGSVYFGDERRGAFLGIRNRLTKQGWEWEDIPLPDALYERIRQAYLNLCELR